MKNQLILHIPHSSVIIPCNNSYSCSQLELEAEILKLTDWYTDELFHSFDNEMIIAEFSRIFCDPERFTDDSQEIMAQYGMGVLYDKNDDGEVIRIVTPELRQEILSKYYYSHHQKLSLAVERQLVNFGSAFIIDCHSFPDTPLKRDLNQSPIRPDFNIGTDKFHTPKKLIDEAILYFENLGFTLGVDWPYKGTIVPLEHYQTNKRVGSIMLEINRKLYLKEGSNEKSDGFFEIKKITEEFINLIKKSL